MKPMKKAASRTCCGCREIFPKKELIRIVRKPDEAVSVDVTGKLNGRGAYICADIACFDKARRTGSIGRSLKIQIPAQTYDELRAGLIEALGSEENEK